MKEGERREDKGRRSYERGEDEMEGMVREGMRLEMSEEREQKRRAGIVTEKKRGWE